MDRREERPAPPRRGESPVDASGPGVMFGDIRGPAGAQPPQLDTDRPAAAAQAAAECASPVSRARGPLYGEVVAAVCAGDAERLEALLGLDMTLLEARDTNGLSVITLARYHGRLDLVELLLRRHPVLDIFEAATVGQAGRVSELLDRDPGLARAISSDGFTPLHLASYFGHGDVARRLVRRGADVMSVSRNAMAAQPLHSAAAGRNLVAVEYLLRRGAAVNARQAGGWTALHIAAANGELAIVGMLRNAGARQTPGEDGSKPEDLAKRNGHDDVVSRLRDKKLSLR
jgi:uncharacterized protein